MRNSLVKLVMCVAIGTSVCSAAIISLLPSSSTISQGGDLTIAVELSDVNDLYAFQFDVQYDPGIIAAVSVSPGTFLNGVSFFPGFIDNTLGVVTFVADSISGPGAGVSGTGLLASIVLSGNGPGTAQINVVNAILLDSLLSDIFLSGSNGASVSVVIPEPSTGWMLCVVAGCVLLKRRL